MNSFLSNSRTSNSGSLMPRETATLETAEGSMLMSPRPPSIADGAQTVIIVGASRAEGMLASIPEPGGDVLSAFGEPEPSDPIYPTQSRASRATNVVSHPSVKDASPLGATDYNDEDVMNQLGYATSSSSPVASQGSNHPQRKGIPLNRGKRPLRVAPIRVSVQSTQQQQLSPRGTPLSNKTKQAAENSGFQQDQNTSLTKIPQKLLPRGSSKVGYRHPAQMMGSAAAEATVGEDGIVEVAPLGDDDDHNSMGDSMRSDLQSMGGFNAGASRLSLAHYIRREVGGIERAESSVAYNHLANASIRSNGSALGLSAGSMIVPATSSGPTGSDGFGPSPKTAKTYSSPGLNSSVPQLSNNVAPEVSTTHTISRGNAPEKDMSRGLHSPGPLAYSPSSPLIGRYFTATEKKVEGGESKMQLALSPEAMAVISQRQVELSPTEGVVGCCNIGGVPKRHAFKMTAVITALTIFIFIVTGCAAGVLYYARVEAQRQFFENQLSATLMGLSASLQPPAMLQQIPPPSDSSSSETTFSSTKDDSKTQTGYSGSDKRTAKRPNQRWFKDASASSKPPRRDDEPSVVGHGTGGFFSKMITENRKIKRTLESVILQHRADSVTVKSPSDVSNQTDTLSQFADSQGSGARVDAPLSYMGLALAVADDVKSLSQSLAFPTSGTAPFRAMSNAETQPSTTSADSNLYFLALASDGANSSLATSQFNHNLLLSLLVEGTQMVINSDSSTTDTGSVTPLNSKAELRQAQLKYRRKLSASLESLPHKGAAVGMLFPLMPINADDDDNEEPFPPLTAFTEGALYQLEMVGATFPPYSTEETYYTCSASNTKPVVLNSGTIATVSRDTRWRIKVPYVSSTMSGPSMVLAYNLTTSEDRLDDLSSSACNVSNVIGSPYPNTTSGRSEVLSTRVAAQFVHLLEQTGQPEVALIGLLPSSTTTTTSPTTSSLTSGTSTLSAVGAQEAITKDSSLTDSKALARGKWGPTKAVSEEASQSIRYEFTYEQLYRIAIPTSSGDEQQTSDAGNVTAPTTSAATSNSTTQSHWYTFISTTNRWDSLNEVLSEAASNSEGQRSGIGSNIGTQEMNGGGVTGPANGLSVLYIVEINSGVVLASSVANARAAAATSSPNTSLSISFYQKLVDRSLRHISEKIRSHAEYARQAQKDKSWVGDNSVILSTSDAETDFSASTSSAALRLSPTMLVGAVPLLYTSTSALSTSSSSNDGGGDAIYLIQAVFPYLQSAAAQDSEFSSDPTKIDDTDGIYLTDDGISIFFQVALGPLIILVAALIEISLVFLFVKLVHRSYVKSLRGLVAHLAQFDISGATHYLHIKGGIRRRRRRTTINAHDEQSKTLTAAATTTTTTATSQHHNTTATESGLEAVGGAPQKYVKLPRVGGPPPLPLHPLVTGHVESNSTVGAAIQENNGLSNTATNTANREGQTDSSASVPHNPHTESLIVYKPVPRPQLPPNAISVRTSQSWNREAYEEGAEAGEIKNDGDEDEDYSTETDDDSSKVSEDAEYPSTAAPPKVKTGGWFDSPMASILLRRSGKSTSASGSGSKSKRASDNNPSRSAPGMTAEANTNDAFGEARVTIGGAAASGDGTSGGSPMGNSNRLGDSQSGFSNTANKNSRRSPNHSASQFNKAAAERSRNYSKSVSYTKDRRHQHQKNRKKRFRTKADRDGGLLGSSTPIGKLFSAVVYNMRVCQPFLPEDIIVKSRGTSLSPLAGDLAKGIAQPPEHQAKAQESAAVANPIEGLYQPRPNHNGTRATTDGTAEVQHDSACPAAVAAQYSPSEYSRAGSIDHTQHPTPTAAGGSEAPSVTSQVVPPQPQRTSISNPPIATLNVPIKSSFVMRRSPARSPKQPLDEGGNQPPVPDIVTESKGPFSYLPMVGGAQQNLPQFPASSASQGGGHSTGFVEESALLFKSHSVLVGMRANQQNNNGEAVSFVGLEETDSQSLSSRRESRVARSTVVIIEGEDRVSNIVGSRKSLNVLHSYSSLGSQQQLDGTLLPTQQQAQKAALTQTAKVTDGSGSNAGEGATVNEDGGSQHLALPCSVDENDMIVLVDGVAPAGAQCGSGNKLLLLTKGAAANSTPVVANTPSAAVAKSNTIPQMLVSTSIADDATQQSFAPHTLPSMQPIEDNKSSSQGVSPIARVDVGRRFSAIVAESHTSSSLFAHPFKSVSENGLFSGVDGAQIGESGSFDNPVQASAAPTTIPAPPRRTSINPLAPLSVGAPAQFGLSFSPREGLSSSNLNNGATATLTSPQTQLHSSAAVLLQNNLPASMVSSREAAGMENANSSVTNSQFMRQPSQVASSQGSAFGRMSPTPIVVRGGESRPLSPGNHPNAAHSSSVNPMLADILGGPPLSPASTPQTQARPHPLMAVTNTGSLQRQSSSASIISRGATVRGKAHMSAAARDSKIVKASFVVCEIGFTDRPTFEKHAQRVTGFAAVVAECCRSFGGVIAYFTGDTVGITFNALVSTVKHEEAACRCSLAIIGHMLTIEPKHSSLVAAVTSGTGMVATTGSGPTEGGGPAAPQSALLPSSSFAAGSASALLASNTFKAVPPNHSATMNPPLARRPVAQVIVSEAFVLGQRMLPLARQLGVRILVDQKISEATSYGTIPVDVIVNERYFRKVAAEGKKEKLDKQYGKATVVFELQPHIKQADLVAVAEETSSVQRVRDSKTLDQNEKNYWDLVDMASAFALLRKGKYSEAAARYKTVKNNKQSKRLFALCQRLIVEGARRRAAKEQAHVLKQQQQQQQLFHHQAMLNQQQQAVDDWNATDVEFDSMISDVSSNHSASSGIPHSHNHRGIHHFPQHHALKKKGKINSFNLDAASFAVSMDTDSTVMGKEATTVTTITSNLPSARKGRRGSNNNTINGEGVVTSENLYRRREMGWEPKLGDKVVNADIAYKLFLLNQHTAGFATNAEAAMDASHLGSTIQIVAGGAAGAAAEKGNYDIAAVSCSTLHRYSINSRFTSRVQSPALGVARSVAASAVGAANTGFGDTSIITTGQSPMLSLMGKRMHTVMAHPVAGPMATQSRQQQPHTAAPISFMSNGASSTVGNPVLNATDFAAHNIVDPIAGIPAPLSMSRRNSLNHTLVSSGAGDDESETSKSTNSIDSSVTSDGDEEPNLGSEAVQESAAGLNYDETYGSANNLLGGNMIATVGDAPLSKEFYTNYIQNRQGSSMALLNDSLNDFSESIGIASRSPSRAGAAMWGPTAANAPPATLNNTTNNTNPSHSTPSVSRSNSPGAGLTANSRGGANNLPYPSPQHHMPVHSMPASALGGAMYMQYADDEEEEGDDEVDDFGQSDPVMLYLDEQMSSPQPITSNTTGGEMGMPAGIANDYDSQDSNNKSDDDDGAAYWTMMAQKNGAAGNTAGPQGQGLAPNTDLSAYGVEVDNGYDSQDSNNKSDDDDGAAYWAMMAQKQSGGAGTAATAASGAPKSNMLMDLVQHAPELMANDYDSQDSNNKSDDDDGAAYWAMMAQKQNGGAAPSTSASTAAPKSNMLMDLVQHAPELLANDYDSQDSNNKSDDDDGANYWAMQAQKQQGLFVAPIYNVGDNEVSLPIGATSTSVSASVALMRSPADHTKALEPQLFSSILGQSARARAAPATLFEELVVDEVKGPSSLDNSDNGQGNAKAARVATHDISYSPAIGGEDDRTDAFASPPITPAFEMQNSNKTTPATAVYPMPYGYALLPTGGLATGTFLSDLTQTAPHPKSGNQSTDTEATVEESPQHPGYARLHIPHHESILGNHSPPISLSENVVAVNAALFAMTSSQNGSGTFQPKHPNYGGVVGVVPVSGVLSSPIGDIYTNENTTGGSNTPHLTRANHDMTQAFVSNCCSPSMPMSTHNFMQSAKENLAGTEESSINERGLDSRRTSSVQQLLRSRQDLLISLKPPSAVASGHPSAAAANTRRGTGTFHFQATVPQNSNGSPTAAATNIAKEDTPLSHAGSPEDNDEQLRREDEESPAVVRFDMPFEQSTSKHNSAGSSLSAGVIPLPHPSSSGMLAATSPMYIASPTTATNVHHHQSYGFNSNPLNQSESGHMGSGVTTNATTNVNEGSPITFQKIKHPHLLSVDTNTNNYMRDNSSANFPMTSAASTTAVSTTPNTTSGLDQNQGIKVFFSSIVENSTAGAAAAAVVYVPQVGHHPHHIASLLGASQHTSHNTNPSLTPFDHSEATTDGAPALGALFMADDFQHSGTDDSATGGGPKKPTEGSEAGGVWTPPTNRNNTTNATGLTPTIATAERGGSPAYIVNDNEQPTEEEVMDYLHSVSSGSNTPSRRLPNNVPPTAPRSDRNISPPFTGAVEQGETPRNAYLRRSPARSVSPRKRAGTSPQSKPLISPQDAAASAAAALPTTFTDTMGHMYNRTDREVGRSSKGDFDEVPSSPYNEAAANNAKKRRDGYYPYFDLTPPMYNLQTRIRSYLSINNTSGRFLAAQCFLPAHFEAFVHHDRKRVEKEARRLTTLNHDNLINIAAYGIEGDFLCILSQYVAQANLRRLLKEARPAIPFASARRYLKDILSAVGYLHRKGVVHGCLRPECIVVDETGTCKIGDFGITRLYFGRHATAPSSSAMKAMAAAAAAAAQNSNTLNATGGSQYIASRQQSALVTTTTPTSAIPQGPSFARSPAGGASAFNMSATSSQCATPRADPLAGSMGERVPTHGALAAFHRNNGSQLFHQQQRAIDRAGVATLGIGYEPVGGSGQPDQQQVASTPIHNATVQSVNTLGGTINSTSATLNGTNNTVNASLLNATSVSVTGVSMPPQAKNPYLSMANFCDKYLDGSMVKYMSPEACANAVLVPPASIVVGGGGVSNTPTSFSNTVNNMALLSGHMFPSMPSSARMNGGGGANGGALTTQLSFVEGTSASNIQIDFKNNNSRLQSLDHLPIADAEDPATTGALMFTTNSAQSSSNANGGILVAVGGKHHYHPQPNGLMIDGVEVVGYGASTSGFGATDLIGSDSNHNMMSSASSAPGQPVASPLSPSSVDHPRTDAMLPLAARQNQQTQQYQVSVNGTCAGGGGPQSPLFFSNTHANNGAPTSTSSQSSNVGGAGNTASTLNMTLNNRSNSPTTTTPTPLPLPAPTVTQNSFASNPTPINHNNTITSSTNSGGSPLYLTSASDVYSIGILFLEMVTGSHPWRGVALPTVLAPEQISQQFSKAPMPSFAAYNGNSSQSLLGAATSVSSYQQQLQSRKVPSTDFEYMGSMAAISMLSSTSAGLQVAHGTGGAVVVGEGAAGHGSAKKQQQKMPGQRRGTEDDFLLMESNTSGYKNASASSNQNLLNGNPSGDAKSLVSHGAITVSSTQQQPFPIPSLTLPVGNRDLSGLTSPSATFPTALSGRAYTTLAFVGRDAREVEVDFIRDFAFMALQPNPAKRATVKEILEMFFPS